jgi:hypothetical protein
VKRGCEGKDVSRTLVFSSQVYSTETIKKAAYRCSDAVEQYAHAGGEHGDALLNFGPYQSEVILRSTLDVSEIKAFCGAVPALETLCRTAGLSGEEQEEEIWKRMVQMNLFAGDPYWIEDDAAQRTVDGVVKRFQERLLVRRG